MSFMIKYFENKNINWVVILKMRVVLIFFDLLIIWV